MDLEFKQQEITKPEHVAPAIEEVRAHLRSIATKDTVTQEALERAGKDLERITGEIEQARKDAAAAVEAAKLVGSTMPSSRASLEKNLRHFPRTRLIGQDPHNGVQIDPEFGVALGNDLGARHRMHDFFMQDEKLVREFCGDEVTESMLRARRMHDACVIVDAYMNAVGGTRAAEYQRRGGIRNTRLFGTYQDLVLPFERALAEGSGAGGTAPTGTGGTAWVPTGYATTLIEDVRAALRLLNQFQTINMPQNPYLFPVQGLPVKGYKTPEASGDFGASGYSASSPSGILIGRAMQSLNMLFNAVKLTSLMTTSTELEEDSIVPIVSMIRTEIAFAIASMLEDAGWNGNYTSWIDTGWALSTPSTNTDWRTAWDGIRYAAYQCRAVTTVDAAGGGLTGDMFALVKGLMGRFGGMDTPDDIVWGMGFMSFAKCLMLKDSAGFALATTMDKAGGNATWQSGVLPKILGGDVIVGQDYPQTLDANGLMTNTANTLTSVTCANKRAWKVGVRRGVLIEASRERLFEYDQILFRGTARYHLKPVWTPGSGTAPLQYTVAGQIKNIPTV